MTRIAHVITGLMTGGAEMMLVRLLSASNGDWEPTVVSLMDQGTLGPQITALGIPIHSLHLRRRAVNPIRSLRIIPLIRRLRPHLIVGWMGHGNLMASIAGFASGHRVPVFWNVQRSLYDLRQEPWLTATVIRLGAPLSRYTTAIVYNSRLAAQQHAAFGYDPSKGIVIPAGFDCGKFRRDGNEGQKLRADLGLNQNTVLVGLIARFHPVKGHDNFLKAASIVVRQCPSAHFVLVGTGVTSEEPELMRMIAESQLSGRISLLGERSDVAYLTAGLDIACSASSAEGFSNTVGEAMACGVPCVVTDVGDSAYLIADTGLAVPPRDPLALANAIIQLILAGSGYRQRLGQAARDRIESEFSLPQIARRYESLYRQYLSHD